MQRTCEFYLALGYDTPYCWAHYLSAPFQPLKKRFTFNLVMAGLDPPSMLKWRVR